MAETPTPTTPDSRKRKMKSYTVAYKLEAIQWFKDGNSKEATARKFNVDSKRIREWVKQEEKLRAANHGSNSKRRKLDGGGRRPLDENLETELVQWIEDQRAQRLRVTRKRVQRRALELFDHENADSPFVASRGWLEKFFNRHGITLRRRTTLAQKVPDAVIPKLMSYFLFVRSLCLRFLFQDSQIGAMDETPVWFDMPGDTTVDFTGTKSIPLKTTGHEKSRITVVLAAKANGVKLPPFIVFKGVRKDKELDNTRRSAHGRDPGVVRHARDTTVDFTGTKSIPLKTTGHEKSRYTVVLAAKANGVKLPPFIVFKGVRKDKELDNVRGVVSVMSSNGWMNEDLTLVWLTKVWGALAFGKRLLAWDAFRCHIMDTVKDKLRRLNTEMAVIPGGCTGLVQAPDVCWNQPFKTACREQYDEWMANGEKFYTKGGNMRAPPK
ncbi:PREDICTED: tigger transposable element-derived protein 1-like [Priapulus caudatus]|uniref:Tigger transposable element-derived protein 1-like n=1 Tax=Priapulus caudatus TaxID=37621 RepID=A0ABM1F217_PRICU|nr:PREDICTED: tigger transposable element-derived protein 1-like [Priapulus caudatus]